MRPGPAHHALLLLALIGCRSQGEPADSTTPADDAGDTDTDTDGDTDTDLGDEDIAVSSMTFGTPDHLPVKPTRVSATEGRVVLATLHGVLELTDDGWESLDDGSLGSLWGLAAYGDTLVASNADGAFQMGPDTDGFEPLTELGSRVTLERGLAGVFASNGTEAWKVQPELEYLGDSGGVVAANCDAQVDEGQLSIFSQDIDGWVDLPLPDELDRIFEFAAKGELDRWVFGADSVWFTQDFGETWRATTDLTGLSFSDVRRDGDRLVTVMSSGLAWSDDGGLSWQRNNEGILAYQAHDIADGRAVYVDSLGGVAPVLRSLELESGATPEPMLALPRQVLGSAMAMLDGEPWVVSAEGVFALDGELQTCHFCGIDTLDGLRAASVNGGTNDGVWLAGWAGNPHPMRLNRPGSVSWTGGTAEGWPTFDTYYLFTATALAPTADGIAACTGDTEVSGASVGAGVFSQTESDQVWRSVGTDFPASSADSSHPASCSALFQAGDRLYAVADGQTLGLDDAGNWVQVQGIDIVTDIAETDDGYYAIVDGQLAWSADGWAFDAPDPRTEGTTTLDALDGLLVAVQHGELLLGAPDDRAAVGGLEDDAVKGIFVRDGRILVTTTGDQLVWAE
jgi:hypothetical protein